MIWKLEPIRTYQNQFKLYAFVCPDKIIVVRKRAFFYLNQNNHLSLCALICWIISSCGHGLFIQSSSISLDHATANDGALYMFLLLYRPNNKPFSFILHEDDNVELKELSILSYAYLIHPN